MGITSTVFGRTAEGKTANIFTFTNENDLLAKVTDFGAILTEMHVPDARGSIADVTLGFDSLDGYVGEHPYFGATVGRVANRIVGGRFTLDGKEYSLATNDGANHLHGGNVGFDKVLWKSEQIKTPDGPGLKLSHQSPDADEGYPGNLSICVIYSLNNANELTIEMTATTDKPTPVNLVNHAYWNLAGHASGDILGHEMMINADRYTAVDEEIITTGEIALVKGSPLDFRQPTTIGKRIAKTNGGYDHNFVLNGQAGQLRLAAKASEPNSRRVLEVHTTEPGVQFYTGNFLDGSLSGKGNAIYQKYAAFCLETQHYPDSVNKPQFPSTILSPGDTYQHTMVHKFYVL